MVAVLAIAEIAVCRKTAKNNVKKLSSLYQCVRAI